MYDFFISAKETFGILQRALGHDTIGLRLAYVKTRKPDVSQLCAHRVLIGG